MNNWKYICLIWHFSWELAFSLISSKDNILCVKGRMFKIRMNFFFKYLSLNYLTLFLFEKNKKILRFS